MNTFKKTITVTLGDQAENHVGMEKIGTAATSGFTHAELLIAQTAFENAGAVQTELINLHDELPEALREGHKAYLLIIRGGVEQLLRNGGQAALELFKEQDSLEVDKKAFMYGRVVHKHARHNLCFADYDQEPQYEDGKGRIIAFQNVPLLKHVREELPKYLGEKATELMAEANYYFDTQKCGIGWHGDAERRVVVGIRLGEILPLHYQWFHRHKPVGNTIKLLIGHGDIYVMSDKAVGWDWKRSSQYTLRHAAGADKFLELKKKRTDTQVPTVPSIPSAPFVPQLPRITRLPRLLPRVKPLTPLPSLTEGLGGVVEGGNVVEGGKVVKE